MLTVFTFSIVTYSHQNIHFEVTLLFVETMVVVNKVSQVVLFIRIQQLEILNDNTTMHAYKINCYCYCLYIVGNNFKYFVDSIKNHSEQQGKWIFLFLLNTDFLRFNSLYSFDALNFILRHSHSLYFLLNGLFSVTEM